MYKLLLCQRYLRTRYIALASVISVTLGVATMIVVNSVMAGFGTEMRERIHGILADMVLECRSTDGFPDSEAHMRKIREVAGEYIVSMSPTVEIYGMLSFQYIGEWITRPVTLIGIDPATKAQVGTLAGHLENYQPRKDRDGKTAVAPARSSNQPPNWDLLEEYLTYRRLRIEQQRLFRNEPPEESDELKEPAASREFGATTEPGGLRPRLARDSLAGDAKDVFDNTVENPFEQEMANGPKGAAQPAVDPASPLEGRLYVGAGLISFNYEDKETGAIRTVPMVQPGDDVKLSTVTAGRPPNAVHFDATIVDVFKSGMSEYDQNFVFCNLEYLQKVRGMFDPGTGQIDPKTGTVDPATCVRSVTTIQIKLKNFADANKVAERLSAAFSPQTYTIRTWEQKQGPLLAAVAVETAILNVLLFLIVAVAGFGILAIFFMIVVEKTRDIGILKALGASSSGVLTIFMSYGLGLGIVGSGAGVILGLLFVWNINTIENWLTYLTGVEVFDERIYYFPVIPTHVEPMMVIWVAAGAMAIAVMASILPARRAARLHPVQALRYE